MSWYVLPWWSVKGELSVDNRKVVKHAKENVRYSRGVGALGSRNVGRFTSQLMFLSHRQRRPCDPSTTRRTQRHSL